VDNVPGKGHLIAICGIDGSGKTVQCELLCRRARQAGWRVETMGFPRYGEGFFADLVARYLRGEFGQDPAQVNPYLAALPFACDRWEAAPTLRAWLATGALVVCNRFVAANLAHQGAKIAAPAERGEFLRWVEELEYGVFALPRPAVNVWLDMPVEIACTLISKKGERKYLRQTRDIHESSLSHLKATHEVYRELAERGDDWVTIECSREGQPLPPEEIAERVWSAVSQALKRAGRCQPQGPSRIGGQER